MFHEKLFDFDLADIKLVEWPQCASVCFSGFVKMGRFRNKLNLLHILIILCNVCVGTFGECKVYWIYPPMESGFKCYRMPIKNMNVDLTKVIRSISVSDLDSKDGNLFECFQNKTQKIN